MKTWLKVVLAAIAFTIIAQILHLISTTVTMSYYTDPAYAGVWSKTMMPTEGAPPMDFYYYSIAISFIIGLIFAGVYSRVSSAIKGSNLQKGLRYGIGLFLVTGIPYFLTNVLLVYLPLGLQISWLIIDGLITYLIGGIAIAKIVK